MMNNETPRIFVSYRHAESGTDESVNRAHREWVSGFARDLEALGARVIWDAHMRECLSKHSSINTLELPLCAEISRAFPIICNVFMPIVTPAYLERIGYQGGQSGEIKYGVVWEEWQGGLHASSDELGLSELIPIIRSGRPQHLNLSQFSASFVRNGMLDFRDNSKDAYSRGLEKIGQFISGIDVLKNRFSSAEAHIWCATYLEWARVRFPERVRIPVDVWWFNTGAANEFLGAVGKAVYEREAIWYDVNYALSDWQEELLAQQERLNYRLKYSDVGSYVATALRAQDGEFGWDHLKSAASFGKSALKAISGEDPDARCGAYNNTGVALLEIAKKFGEAEPLSEAINYFKIALEDASSDKPDGWLRIKSNIANALLIWGKLENNLPVLKEALAGYEDVVRVSSRSPDEHWRINAENAIKELKACLPK